MARILVLLSHIFMFALFVTGDLNLKNEGKDGEFKLSCKQTGFLNVLTIYWIRSLEHVITTHWFRSPIFTDDESDLADRTETYGYYRTHVIKVETTENDVSSFWYCCRYIFRYFQCSNPVYVNPDSTGETMTTPYPPTMMPDITEPDQQNGTLSLMSSSETITVGQHLHLTCSIDNDIDETKWIVFWYFNDTSVFVTYNNRYRVISENSTELLRKFPSGNITFDEIESGFDERFPNISVRSDLLQHNVTVLGSSFLFGRSVWNCASPYVNRLSNNRTINVKDLPTTTGDETSPMAYIVAGSVGGVVFFILVAIMVILLLRWRSTKQNIMEDNILYVGGKENTSHGNTIYKDDEKGTVSRQKHSEK